MLVRRRRRDRDDFAFAHRAVQRVAELVVGELLPVEIPGQKIFVGFDNRLDELLPVPTDSVSLFLRDVSHGVLRPSEDLAVQEIDRRFELLVLSDGNMERDDPDAVGLSELLQDPVKVGVLAIEAADYQDPRGSSFFELRPDRLRPDLNAGRGVHKHDRGVGDAKGSVLVASEVRIARGVDEIDLRALVRERGEGHVDGDVPLLLLGIRVQDAGAVIDLAEASRRPDRVEEGLDEARLTRSSMADDGHISDLRGLR